ncbi:MAG: hypothetical protein R3207_13170, partial [Oceanospirillum sp.]|nr:hypothetical protein [Oceanospirillum sp.]
FLLDHLPEDCAISQPTGGMVLWLQIPGLNSKQLWQEAIAEELDLRIGPAFTTLELYQDYVRINTGWPLDEKIEVMLARFVELVKKQLFDKRLFGKQLVDQQIAVQSDEQTQLTASGRA